MATYTSFLNLEKPTTSETFNLLKLNQNWDKIDQGVSALNSKMINKNSYETAFDIEIPSSATASRFYCDRIGRTVFCDLVFYTENQIPSNTKIAHVNNIQKLLDSHFSAIGSSNGLARMRIGTTGNVIVENTIPGTQWYSCSFIVLYNDSAI